MTHSDTFRSAVKCPVCAAAGIAADSRETSGHKATALPALSFNPSVSNFSELSALHRHIVHLAREKVNHATQI